MKTYLELRLTDMAEGQSDLLVAALSELGFSGFLEEGNDLVAYAEKGIVDPDATGKVLEQYGCKAIIGELEEQNWNQVWEASFQPVRVDDFVAVRADFHKVVGDVEHEILITPKMSFGTGHHATTWLMLDAIRSVWSLGEDRIRKVVDYGTGTGILAILAEKMGADEVLAIDNDAWSIANATENLLANGCRKIQISEAGEIPEQLTFDLVLANINKNILLANSHRIISSVAPGGFLLLSGILLEDLEEILTAYQAGLGIPIFTRERANWLVVGFQRASVQG